MTRLRLLGVPLVWLSCYHPSLPPAVVVASEQRERARTTSVPIVVTFSRVDPVEQSVTFGLQNTGEKTITAWQVRIVIGHEPEIKGRRFGSDDYLVFSGVAPGPGTYILPGATVDVTHKVNFDAELVAPVAVTTPTAAIFADRSSAGDKRYIERTFLSRAAHLKTWQQIGAELERARASGGRQPDLERLLSDHPSSDNLGDFDVMRHAFRINVAAALREIRSGKATPASKLESLMDMAQRNLAAADAHSLPREF